MMAATFTTAHFQRLLAPTEWAHQTLAAARNGIRESDEQVDIALHITGDLPKRKNDEDDEA